MDETRMMYRPQEAAVNAAAGKRKQLAEKRQAYEQAVAAMQAADMVAILSDVAAVAMLFNPASEPHVACHAVGRIQAYLDMWYRQHRVIEEYHRLRRELEKLDRERMRNG